jgi:hypothetical protein
MLKTDVGFEASLLFGPVRAERALELWLDSALVALMPDKVRPPYVRLAAFQAEIRLRRPCKSTHTHYPMKVSNVILIKIL